MKNQAKQNTKTIHVLYVKARLRWLIWVPRNARDFMWSKQQSCIAITWLSWMHIVTQIVHIFIKYKGKNVTVYGHYRWGLNIFLVQKLLTQLIVAAEIQITCWSTFHVPWDVYKAKSRCNQVLVKQILQPKKLWKVSQIKFCLLLNS